MRVIRQKSAVDLVSPFQGLEPAPSLLLSPMGTQITNRYRLAGSSVKKRITHPPLKLSEGSAAPPSAMP